VKLLDVADTWTQEDRAENRWPPVLFEVPPGVEAIRVELTYEPTGGAVLDLGLEAPHQYVGWSGGARRYFLVSEEWSTPGYQPVPVVEGTWRILVGLHRIPPAGVRFRLTALSATRSEVEQERAAQPTPPPVPERPPRRDLPAPAGLRWMAADFHAHTLHSDGALSIDELAALAVTSGLDALAVTDHNTTSHHAHLPAASQRYGVSLLAGQEVTTDLGHANAFGDIGFVDFRQLAAEWQREVAARGGILSVNHPLAGDCCWRMPLPRPTAVAEIWHWSWHALPVLDTWGGPLAWWLAWDQQATPIGGSDFHAYGSDGMPGSPTTWVLAEGEDVLGGLAAGRTAISAGRDGPVVLRLGDDLIAADAEGLLLSGFETRSRVVRGEFATFSAGRGPWWLEDERSRVYALCG
jgi:PHP domain